MWHGMACATCHVAWHGMTCATRHVAWHGMAWHVPLGGCFQLAKWLDFNPTLVDISFYLLLKRFLFIHRAVSTAQLLCYRENSQHKHL